MFFLTYMNSPAARIRNFNCYSICDRALGGQGFARGALSRPGFFFVLRGYNHCSEGLFVVYFGPETSTLGVSDDTDGNIDLVIANYMKNSPSHMKW